MSTEQQILAILLNRPNDKNLININADWFLDPYCKWLFEAIRNTDRPNPEALEIWGVVKTQHPEIQLTLHDVTELKERYLHDAELEILVLKLHKTYLSHQLQTQMQRYLQAPIDENLQAVKETMGILENVKVQEDTGEVDSTLDKVVDSLNHPAPHGIRTYRQLDAILGDGLYGGMLLTIGARPAVGKTAIAINLAYQIVRQDPEVQVDFFTLEMNKRSLVNRFIARETGINSYVLRDPYGIPSAQQQAIKNSIEQYWARRIRIYDRTPNLADVLQVIRRNAAKTNPHKYVAIVDYIGLINVPGNDPRHVAVGKITRQLKIATNEYNIPIIELSQLNRAINTRQDKAPVLSDLRESGSIEQDSNVVAMLYNLDSEHPDVKVLKIEKNRDGETGELYMGFDGGRMLFQPIDRNEAAGNGRAV